MIIKTNSPHALATCETTPWVYWQANVLEIVAKTIGGGVNVPSEWQAKMSLWYRSGETVEMAAQTLATVCDIVKRASGYVIDVRPGVFTVTKRREALS